MTISRNLLSRLTFPILAFASIALFLPQDAHAQESRWQLRLRGLLVDGGETFTVDDSSGTQVLAGGNAELGVGVAIEYRISNRFGVELGAAVAGVPDYEGDHESSDGKTAIGEGPSFAPVTASFNLHLTPGRRFDFYIAPTVAFVSYGDFDLDLSEGTVRFESEDDVAWGGTIGFDSRFGASSWGFNAAVTYLSSDLKISEVGSDDTFTLPFDPLMVQLGVTFAF